MDALSDNSKTALFFSVENGVLETVRTLLDARVDIACDELGAIPLHAAVLLGATNHNAAALTIAQMLLEKGKGLQLTCKNKQGVYRSMSPPVQ